ncbi:MAG: agmatinase [Clostridiales Family XIII bacterium]|jgi:agmatinase|nr:agmatinase [Clostridiales Family XIII bacterium]
MIDIKTNWQGLCTDRPEDASICVLGIPFDGGASQGRGAAEAPQHIRQLAAAHMPYTTDDWVLASEPLIYDAGDVEIDLDWGATFRRVETQAYELMKKGKFNFFFGGDHSVTIPLHRAFGRWERERNTSAKIGILHFDAHFDLCARFGGHEWSHANTERRAVEDIISPGDLCFLGIRAAEPDELDFVRAHPEITTISATEVFTEGYRNAFEIIKEKFQGYDAVYFTLDVDVLDPAYAPGTGTPVAGGISSRELIQLVRLVLRELNVTSMDLVEVAPPLDTNDITSWAAIRIFEEVISVFAAR